MYLFCLFFFKQKTAYEMRISDWSSDVCSSDLLTEGIGSEKIEVADPARSGNPDRSVAEGECVIVVFRSQVHAQRGVAIGICRADSSVGEAGNIAVILAGEQCRSEEHTSELQSLMRTSYAVFCLKKKIDHPCT